MKNKALTAGAIVAVLFLILTLSIAIPIYIRPFYYAHITALDLPGETGWAYAEIKRAYDDMINFCTLFAPFATGSLAWSQEGKDHFTDVRVLFMIDVAVLAVSASYLILLSILKRRGRYAPVRFLGHGASFYGAVASVAIPVEVGALAAIDFNRAFEVFHAIFFPGKDNWLFDPRTDEIIRVMPEAFFRNCAILIGCAVLLIALTLIVRDCMKNSRLRRETAMRNDTLETNPL